MSKMRIALESFVECLAYMLLAILSAVCGKYLSGTYSWIPAAALCIGVCALMAYMNYSGKVYGYGFDDAQKDEEDERND